MARSLRINYPNALYHVTCRGNEQKAIYRDESDYSAFIVCLQKSLETYQAILHSYVLMTNHFHLLVEAPQGNLSAFMRHLNVTYAGYFNRRHHRVGHLYQGRFKAIVVEADTYLLELSRYIHLNPIRIKKYEGSSIEERLKILKVYPWSSLMGYVKSSRRESYVTYDRVLGYLGGAEEKRRRVYAGFVEEGAQKGVESPLEKVFGQIILGKETFIQEIKKVFQKKSKNREQPSLAAIHRVAPERVIGEVCRVLHLDEKAICLRRGGWPRNLLMECLYRYSGLTQREIGERMGGVGYSRVSRARGDLRRLMQKESKIEKAAKQVERLLENQK